MPDPSSSQERRRSKRIPLCCDVLITIVYPERTFTPHSMRGVAMDNSHSGAKAKTYQIGREEYKDLMKEVRYAKLLFSFPYFDDLVEVSARVVWLEYQDVKGNQPAVCNMGFYFEKMEDDTAARIDYVINRLDSESMASDL